MAACLCLVTMGMTVSADVIGSASQPIASKKSILTAERTYQPPSSSGASYYYVTRAYYSDNSLIADSWTLTGFLKLSNSQERVNAVKGDAAGIFVSKTRLTTQEQYVSGDFTSTAVSSVYGTVTVELNVEY